MPRGISTGVGSLALLALLGACSDPGPTAQPPPPAGPGPALYFADQFTPTRQAARAVVDAGTIWLLDANGDFVFGADPAANWSTTSGLALSWGQVAGATKYRVMGRNRDTSPTEWKELKVVTAPDPKLSPTVVATGVNPWSSGLGSGGFPWSFGNHVELAISSENEQGPLPGSSLTDVLSTADEFPGVLNAVAVDPAALPQPYTPATERGATVVKTIRLGFSEPMTTGAPPLLTPATTHLTLRRVLASAWGSGPDAPSATPISAGAHAFLRVELTVRGPCTELLVARRPTDLVLPVRDPTRVTAGAGTRLLFLGGDDGAPVGEATGVASIDAGAGRLVLSSGLPVAVAAGSLVCPLTEPGTPAFSAAAGARVTVSEAASFHLGETVAVYRPRTASAEPLLDLRTVAGVDTADQVLLLSAAPSAGHGPGSVVLPIHGVGGELALRDSAPLALERDAAGGPDAELFVAAPTSVMVGDTLLVDADGDLDTTPDQAQAVVKRVRFAPAGDPVYSVVVDLPASLVLLHGQSAVLGMGDAFAVSGTRDTSAGAVTPLDPHRDQFSPGGLLY